jgi:hypothetical protein
MVIKFMFYNNREFLVQLIMYNLQLPAVVIAYLIYIFVATLHVSVHNLRMHYSGMTKHTFVQKGDACTVECFVQCIVNILSHNILKV